MQYLAYTRKAICVADSLWSWRVSNDR